MNRKLLLSLLLTFALALAACSAGTAEPDPAAEAPAEDTAAVDASAETAAEPAAPAVQEGGTLQTVLDRGTVICVGNANLPGFGFLDEAGDFSGFDVDFCRALAAAVLGDSEAYEIRPTTAAERFTVLQTGEGDVLFRNTTWTLSRDTTLGADFAPITFYDGQGMMVRKESGVSTLADLSGASVCVQTGTTTELNLADQMAAAGIDYEPVVFETVDETTNAYEEGRCDAYTTDKSGLVSVRTTLSDPSAHVILDVTLSKEPLAPMMRQGDDQWRDIVTWTVFTTFLAEELGITSENIAEFEGSTDPNVARLLGQEGEFGDSLGLSPEWAANIISQVGNYAEIYNRNLGPDTLFDLPRGQNALYTEGGLLYSPPVR